MSKKSTRVDETQPETVVDAPETVVDAPETQPEVKRPKKGVVENCAYLNVRADGSMDANILTTIRRGTRVQIDESGSTDDFYKIRTASGVDGFCAKQYIDVQK